MGRGMMGGGMMSRDDGWLFGNDAFDECGIVRSVNTVVIE